MKFEIKIYLRLERWLHLRSAVPIVLQQNCQNHRTMPCLVCEKEKSFEIPNGLRIHVKCNNLIIEPNTRELKLNQLELQAI